MEKGEKRLVIGGVAHLRCLFTWEDLILFYFILFGKIPFLKCALGHQQRGGEGELQGGVSRGRGWRGVGRGTRVAFGHEERLRNF